MGSHSSVVTGMTIAVLGCVACSDEPAGPCAAVSGTYEVQLRSRDPGSCSDLEIVVSPAYGPYDSAECMGDRTQSADGCVYEYDITCPGIDVSGITRANEDASTLRGTDTMCFYDTAGLICCGTFDVTWTRL